MLAAALLAPMPICPDERGSAAEQTLPPCVRYTPFTLVPVMLPWLTIRTVALVCRWRKTPYRLPLSDLRRAVTEVRHRATVRQQHADVAQPGWCRRS